MSERGNLIVIVGPTAVGKTALALALAEELGGEIVSADSRQVYRYMDIGTDKPTPAQRRRVPHHLIDVVEPDQPFTLAQYQEMAYAAINGILARGKLPFLVGGSGLYVKAVVEGWRIPRVEPKKELREELYRQAEESGYEALHSRLRELDPIAARDIDPRNVRRVVRALEVVLSTGQPFSRLRGKSPPPYRILQIGLTLERRELYRRIDERVERMMRQGLVDEVRGLMERGYGLHLPSMSGLGYREIGLYLQGQLSLEEAVRLIKRNTRRFVRHQYNWFSLKDPHIHWFQAKEGVYERVKAFILAWLSSPPGS